jgi:hypothetical protein
MLSKREEHVRDLCAQLGQGRPAVSHHLALLRHGGIIAPRRQGKNNVYSLTENGAELARVVGSMIDPGRTAVKEPRPTAPIDPALLDDVGGFVGDPVEWFHTPNREFEGKRPVDMLGTPDEGRLRNRIAAAKLGMFS